MTTAQTIDPNEFLARVRPALARQDIHGLVTLLRANWTVDQITALLSCDHEDARKAAALALSLVGKRCCVTKLSEQLKARDPLANQMAEHALWSVWFRCGTEEANECLCRGSQALDQREFDSAMEHFGRAIEMDPTFAEAYNQRAIVHYLNEEYAQAIEDSRKAIALMPCHFGAWAGMGHCHMHLGRIQEALRCYREALRINPHLERIAEAVMELQKQVPPEATIDGETEAREQGPGQGQAIPET